MVNSINSRQLHDSIEERRSQVRLHNEEIASSAEKTKKLEKNFQQSEECNLSSDTQVKFDVICDYIPLVSTITNLYDLVMKHIAFPMMDEETVKGDQFYSYLKDKSTIRCMVSLVPVLGNIAIAIYDENVRYNAALSRVKTNGLELKNVWAYQNTFSVVLAAVEQNGMALRYASRELQDDPRIIYAATMQNGLAIQFASLRQKNDPSMVLYAAKQNPGALQFASILNGMSPKFIRDPIWGQIRDRNTLLSAVKINGLSLKDASLFLNQDREIVLAAVRQNGMALQYAPLSLRADKKIVLAASMQNEGALVFASPTLQNEIAIQSVANAAGDDREENALQKVCKNGLELANVSGWQSRKIVLAAVRQNGMALKHADYYRRNDRQIILSAIEQNPNAIEYACIELKNDPTIVRAALQHKMWR